MFGPPQRRRHFVGEHPLAPELGDIDVEPGDVRQAAAEHDDPGVEDVDHRAQGPGQPVLVTG